MEFSKQECWSGLPFASLGDLSNPGMEHGSHELWDSLPSEPPGKQTSFLTLSTVEGKKSTLPNKANPTPFFLVPVLALVLDIRSSLSASSFFPLLFATSLAVKHSQSSFPWKNFDGCPTTSNYSISQLPFAITILRNYSSCNCDSIPHSSSPCLTLTPLQNTSITGSLLISQSRSLSLPHLFPSLPFPSSDPLFFL